MWNKASQHVLGAAFDYSLNFLFFYIQFKTHFCSNAKKKYWNEAIKDLISGFMLTLKQGETKLPSSDGALISQISQIRNES